MQATGERGVKLDKTKLLIEAKALDEIGAEWTQAHAAAFCNISTSFLRRSSCPKHFKVGHGPKGKMQVVYLPHEVRVWNAARRVSCHDRFGRAS